MDDQQQVSATLGAPFAHRAKEFKRVQLTCIYISGIIEIMRKLKHAPPEGRYANMFAALGTEPRLRIVRLLLAAHPVGMNVGEIQAELGIPGSTLSHHLEKLKHEELVRVERQGTFLRYLANTEALQEVLAFLYAECCTRTRATGERKIR